MSAFAGAGAGAGGSHGSAVPAARPLLRLSGMKAEGLRAADRGGTSDPFAVIQVGQEEKKSKTIYQTLDPEWDQEFVFGMEHELEGAGDTFKIILYDWDRLGNDLLGHVVVNLGELWGVGEVGRWHPVLYKGKRTGKIFFNAEIIGGVQPARAPPAPAGPVDPDAPPAATPEPERPPNQLQVHVIEARGLPGHNKDGSNDVIFDLKIGSAKISTHILRNTATPYFNQKFLMPALGRNPVLSLTARHSRKFRSDVDLGKGHVELAEYRNNETEGWFPLRDPDGKGDGDAVGEVHLSLLWLAAGRATVSEPREIGTGGGSAQTGGEVAASLDPEAAEELRERAAEAERQRQERISQVEIKSGDYQVQVHIIEVRDLKSEDMNGTTDPVVFVELLGERQHTETKKAVTSCVFDHLFFFNLKDVDRSEIQAATLNITCFDADTFSTNDLIGEFNLDLTYAYYQEHHEIYRQWLGLVDRKKIEDTGVQGFMRVSVTVLGPGDKAFVHDPEAEARAISDEEEAIASGAADVSSMLLMPPTLKQELAFLVLTLYRAEDLPALDSAGLIGKGGIDAFAQVKFAANPPLRTRYLTARRPGPLNVEWYEELWLPVNLPTMTETVEVAVIDFDKLLSHDRAGTFHLSFGEILKEESPPRWYPIYGAPNGVSGGKNKNRMNRIPSKASNYRGRVLCSARVEKDPLGVHPQEAFKKSATLLLDSQIPREARFLFRACIFGGSELPKLRESFGTAKLGVEICLGDVHLRTHRTKPKNGVCEWGLMLEEELVLPTDPTQMPDIFVYLISGNDQKDRVCFARISTPALLAKGFDTSPEWLELAEDHSINDLKDGQYPGSVLVRLGLGMPGAPEWADDLTQYATTEGYELRVHVYQAIGLSAADDDGSVDPYIIARAGSASVKGSILKNTTCPTWYETLTLETELPPLHLASQLVLELHDHDKFSKDDFLGAVRLSLTDTVEIITSPDQLLPVLKDPVWRPVTRVDAPADTLGSVLVGVQLIRKPIGVSFPVVVEDIAPRTDPMDLEMFILGLRSLAPYMFISPQRPFLEIDVGNKAIRDMTHETPASNEPSGTDPNHLDRFTLPVNIPRNPLFSPTLNLTVRDTRLGGFSKPVLGRSAFAIDRSLLHRLTAQDDQLDLLAGEADEVKVEDEEEEEEADLLSLAEPTVALSASPTSPQGISPPPAPAPTSSPLTSVMPPGIPGAASPQSPLMSPATGAAALPTGALEGKVEEGEELMEREEGDGQTAAPSIIVTKDGSVFAQDEGSDKYLKNRWVLNSTVEELIGPSPFQSFPLYRGVSKKEVGVVKALVRLTNDFSEPWSNGVEMSQLTNPAPYVVRVYVLKGINLQPLDSDGNSDPFLRLQLGDDVIDDADRCVPNTVNPDFYHCYQFKARLPGPSSLRIDCFDHDSISAHDLIGTTVIDLEDRLYNSKWRELGRELPREAGMAPPKPVERRPLWNPRSTTAQGTLEMWVDILSREEAREFPAIDIEKPPPEEYECRVVVYRTKDVRSADMVTKMNDLYVKGWLEGSEPQETDVHWRSKKGKASFNWRFKFPITLPMKYPRLSLQMWDKDLVKYNDCIAETQVDLTRFFNQAHQKKERVKLFHRPPPVPPVEDATGVGAGVGAGAGAGAGAASAPASAVASVGTGAGATAEQLPAYGDDEEDAEAEAGLAFASQGSTAFAPLESTEPLTAGQHYQAEAKASEKKTLLNNEDSKDDAKDTLRSFKKLVGIEDEILPDDAEWIPFRAVRSGDSQVDEAVRRKEGEVLISVEVMPIDTADKLANGFGRSEPNANPELPPPSGRLKFSFNPFYLGMECCGEALCMKFMCCICCIFIILIAVFGAPFMNVAVQVLSALPKALAQFIVILLLLCIIVPCCYCYCKYKWNKRMRAD